MLGYKSLHQKLNTILEQQEQFNALFRLFLENMNKTSQDIKASLDQVSQWQKVIHELETKQILDDLMNRGFNRIYGFVYLHPREGTRKMILIPSPTFEEARTASVVKMKADGLNPEDWLIEGFQFLDIPKNTEISSSTAKKIERHFRIQRPIDVYLNDLKLVKDKFCEKDSEKKLIERVINKIANEHKLKNTTS